MKREPTSSSSLQPPPPPLDQLALFPFQLLSLVAVVCCLLLHKGACVRCNYHLWLFSPGWLPLADEVCVVYPLVVSSRFLLFLGGSIFYICIPGFRAYERHSQLHTHTDTHTQSSSMDGIGKGYDGVYTSSFLSLHWFSLAEWDGIGWDGFWAEREQENETKKSWAFFLPFSFLCYIQFIHNSEIKGKSERLSISSWYNQQRETNRDMMMIMSKSSRLCDKTRQTKKKKNYCKSQRKNGFSYIFFFVLRPPSCLSLSWDYWESGRKEDSIGKWRTVDKMTKRKGTAKPNKKRLWPKNKLNWKDGSAEEGRGANSFLFFIHSFIACLLCVWVKKKDKHWLIVEWRTWSVGVSTIWQATDSWAQR